MYSNNNIVPHPHIACMSTSLHALHLTWKLVAPLYVKGLMETVTLISSSFLKGGGGKRLGLKIGNSNLNMST